MSQAEELLNGMSEEIPVHTHPVPDTDTYFVIDPVTRKIENTNPKKHVIMQYDHNSERCTFELPRFIDGHDMLECTSVTVNVDNIEVVESEGVEAVEVVEPRVNSDAPDMTDLRIHPDDPEKVISSWLISRNSTQLAGILSFHIEYKCVDSNGNIVYEWSTDNYDEYEIRARKKNGEAALAPHSDVLEQWRTRIFGAGDSVMANIAAEGEAQVAAVKAESETQQDAVELKGAQTLDSIPEDYTEVDAMADEAVRSKGDAIVCEAAGESIALKDSSDDHIRGLKLFGKATQKTTTGAQLLPQPYYDSSMVRHGVTFTVNDDGSITMVGTNTAGDSTSCYFMLHSGFSATGIYTYKCYGLPETCVTNIYYRGDAVADSEILLDLYEPNEYGFVIRVKTGATVNATVYPMLNVGETALPYEPYTGGKPAPNPDYPLALASIENPITSLYGKNLLDADALVGGSFVKDNNGYTFTKLENTASSAICALNLPAGDYVMSWEETERTAEWCRLQVSFADGTITFMGLNPDVNKLILSSAVGINDIRFSLASDVTVGTYVKFAWLQIEAGTEPTMYEPYVTCQEFAVNRTIPGIPVTSGGNYTDSDGQQWICDEIDLERGVYVQRVGELILDGKTNMVFKNDEKENNYLYYHKIADGFEKVGGCCTHFTHMEGYPERVQNTFNMTKSYVIFICGLGIVSGDNTSSTAQQEFNDWLYAQYESGNPVTFTYILTTPIETPLTAEEITAFKALRTNYPNTTILNDAGAWMSVEYNADTKSYVDNPKTLKLVDSSTGVVYELKVVDGNLTVVPVQ